MQNMGKSIQKWDMLMEFSGISEKFHGSTPTNKQNSKLWGDVTRIVKTGGCLLRTISRPVQSVFPLPRHRQKGSCASLRMCPVEQRQPAIGRMKNCMANHLGNCNLTTWSSWQFYLYFTSKVGLLPESVSCRNPLAHYIDLVLLQRDISWPSRSVGSGCLNLEYAETCTTVQFNTTQTVGQLWRAEATLGHAVSELYLKCEGLVLSQSAFLQERTYELCEGHLPLDFFTDWVPLTVVFLGHVSVLWSPPCLSYRQLLEWAGIFQFDSLINENSDSLLLHGRVYSMENSHSSTASGRIYRPHT